MPGAPMSLSRQEASSRHQITFATARTLAYVSVLELGTIWERTMRRAHIPLKYSQGYNPRPRMHFAAPLPVGCGSEADLLDVSLEEPLTSEAVRDMLVGVTPPDLSVVDVVAVDEQAPSLSDRLQEAQYRVWLQGLEAGTLETAVATLLEATSLPLPKRGRRHRGKTYDLRSLILALALDPETPAPWVGLHMRLNARPGATGRPDEVLKALGFADNPRRCIRTALILEPLAEPNAEA
ncbi:MAG: DUF2344 domain-containing protein [Anaerolineae bacterium]|nr:DUF2344 domain-containing protein [Anaerolineae bacterium]